MRGIIVVSMASVLLSGCAITKDWTATGGSRADGTIKLSYDYGLFEVPKVREEQALDLASQRCIAWGYQSAAAFGGVTTNCSQFDGFNGCARWTVTKEYQCIGDGPKAANR